MTIVIRGATLIDGAGASPVRDGAVVVEGNTISKVGLSREISVGPEAQIIEAQGKTLLPGFIDTHAHMIAYEYNLEKRITTPASLTVIKTLKNLKATLDGGVTTVRDGGGCDLGYKLAVEQGLTPGPRLFITIVPLSQAGGLFDLPLYSGAKVDLSNITPRVRLFCGGVENVRQITRQLLLEGADVIKISTTGSVYTHPGKVPGPQFTPEEIAAAVYEAKAAGKRSMTHCEGGQGLRNALNGGIDTIEHGFYLTDEDVKLMKERDVWLVPTLACNYGILKVIKRDPKAGIHEQSVVVAKSIIADHAKSIQRAAAAGVKIAMGSDAFGWDQGENLYELELMVGLGFTPMQAIVAGTTSAAKLLGAEDKIGSVTPGKLADILLVDGDPLADIRILQDKSRIQLIMKDGAVYKNTLAA